MLTSRIIPCLDVSDNKVVKGVQFNNLREIGTPATIAHSYEQQGADEIVILDISATNRREQTQVLTVEQVRVAISIPLTVGGGVRSLDDITRLLDAGADRVSINTAAVQTPELVQRCADRFGLQCTVVAVDAKRIGNDWEVCTHAGTNRTKIDVLSWCRQVQDLGAGEILLTSFDRDGTRAGYDCELLTAVSSRVSIPVIASGGADNSKDLTDGIHAGASAVLIASILHDGVTTVSQLKQELVASGVNIRP